MKIIDLLNKIANGEEVPKKIRFYDEIFVFSGYTSASKNYNNELNDLFEELDGSMLNDEVEIIEEDKKIEKIKTLNTDYYRKHCCYESLTKEEITLDIQTLKNKFDEIINKLNEEEK